MSSKVNVAIKQILSEIETLQARQAISEKALEHLREIYKTAWIESHYDPYNNKSYEAAVKIWPHIKALNDELKFKT